MEADLQYPVVIDTVQNGKQGSPSRSSLYSCPQAALVQHSEVQSAHILKSVE